MALQSPLHWLMNHARKPALEFEPLFSLKEASALLGISPLALRRAAKSGQIHSVRLHSRARFKFRESELRKFLDPKKNDEK